jgi:ferric-dicitrate binding protein FerR (iron transport regulator)
VTDEGQHAEAWRRYRRLSRAFWILFLFFLPGLAAIDRALRSLRGRQTVILVIALAWMLAFAVIGYLKWNLRCPRCGELFFHTFDDRPWRRGWVHNPFARRCLHCGLPKWT